ncbi:hypothetical protein MA16_Dca016258 [Dendrobium catenatum]|uniref:Uncharacterized protein n=1 Tax=Dendrobium catenatum TaxID=906689 RepID=A0A2I0W5M1_9ASPA|nr:hypothetical protein MA16_Dca016258 [Dendrobium catenatum]
MTKYYNSHIKVKDFQPADLVMKTADIAIHHSTLDKLTSTWEGTYIINIELNSCMYQVQIHNGRELS